MGEIDNIKFAAISSLFVIALISALVPLIAKPKAFLLALGNTLSAGVFLSTGIIHLLPDAIESLEESIFDESEGDHYPLAPLLSCVGFLLVLILEKVIISGHEAVIFAIDENQREVGDDELIAHSHHHSHHHQHKSNLNAPVHGGSRSEAQPPPPPRSRRSGDGDGGDGAHAAAATPDDTRGTAHATGSIQSQATVGLSGSHRITPEARFVQQHVHESPMELPHAVTSTVSSPLLPRGERRTVEDVLGSGGGGDGSGAPPSAMHRSSSMRRLTASLLHAGDADDEHTQIPEYNEVRRTQSSTKKMLELQRFKYYNRLYVQGLMQGVNLARQQAHDGARMHHHQHGSLTSSSLSRRRSHSLASSGDAQADAADGVGDTLKGADEDAGDGDDVAVDFDLGIALDESQSGFNFLPYLTLIVLSVHASIAGLALGLSGDAKTVEVSFVAILAHKATEGLALGISLVKGGVARGLYVGLVVLFSLTTPLGIGLGYGLMKVFTQPWVSVLSGVMLSLSSGTFIYIANHAIDEEFDQSTSKLQKVLKLSTLLIGFAIMSLVAIAA